MSETKVSIVIPVYNAIEYLEECVQSVLSQSLHNLKVILVDDGSADGSSKLCDQLKSADDRITVIHQENGGMVAARRAGLKIVDTEYVFFLDSDDYVAQEMYEVLLNLAEQNNVDIVTSGCYRYWDETDFFVDNGSRFKTGRYDKSDIRNKLAETMMWNKSNKSWDIDPSLCFKLFRTKFIVEEYERIGNRRFSFGEDTAVIFPLLCRVNSIYIHNEPYYFHRQRPRNTKPGYFLAEDFIDKLTELYHYLLERFQELDYVSLMKKQVDLFFLYAMDLYKEKYYEKNDVDVLFPFDKVEKGSDIVLYGAGKAGKKYAEQINRIKYCDIKMWVDKKVSSENIQEIAAIKEIEFDYVVISIQNQNIAKLVRSELQQMGVPVNKIVN